MSVVNPTERGSTMTKKDSGSTRGVLARMFAIKVKSREILTEAFVTALSGSNPLFIPERFRAACLEND